MSVSIDHIDKITESLSKAWSDINVMVCDSMNASLQSITILTKGYEEMYDSINSLVQKSLENSAKASRSWMSAKSVHDVMDMNSTLWKGGFDSALAEMNRWMQMSSRIAQDAAEPVTQNMNATIIKFSQNRAA